MKTDLTVIIHVDELSTDRYLLVAFSPILEINMAIRFGTSLLTLSLVFSVWLTSLTATATSSAANGEIEFCGETYGAGTTVVNCHDFEVADISPLSRLPKLRRVMLTGKVVDLRPLVGLKHLDEVILDGFRGDLEPLTALTGLKKLSLRMGRPLDWSPLSRLTSVVELDLEDARLNDLKHLQTLTKLRVVNFGTTISWRRGSLDLRPLAKLARLETLTVSSDDADLSPLRRLPKLRWLSVKRGRVAGLKDMPNLVTLIIDEAPVDPLAGLTGLRNLGELWVAGASGISGKKSSVKELGALSSMPKLTKLIISHALGLTDLGPVRHLTRLRFLLIEHTGVSDLSPVSGLVHLQELRVRNSQVSDLRPLAGLSHGKLFLLDVSGNGGLEDITPLKGITTLKRVNAAGTWIKNLDPLRALPRLRSVTVPYYSVPEAHRKAFVEARPKVRVRDSR